MIKATQGAVEESKAFAGHMTGRRRRQQPRRCVAAKSTCATMILSSVLVVLSLASGSAEAFVARSNPSTCRPSACRATREENGTTPDTWSRSPGTSRFGVRKRVRDVLEKAKSRTGRENYSNAEVVADAASIGGLSDESDLVFSVPRAVSSSSSSSSAYVRTNGTNLVPESSVGRNGQPQPSRDVDVDSLLVDENSVDPLPFALPVLSQEQKNLLAAGERVQEQSKMGREGSGFVVLDVEAPPYVVWECLLDFESYPDRIGTVREMRLFTNTHLSSSYWAEKPVLPGTGRETRHYGNASISRASFVLSKFKLQIAAVHKYQPHPDGHYMEFNLDPACKNIVLQDAKGIWYTESNPDGLGDHVTRIWLLCELKVSRLLPKLIVDYAAKRAMPRATTWLKPTVEEMKVQLHGEGE